MKLYVLSSSAFSDNQLNVLKHLGSQYDVTYGVIIPFVNTNFTKEELSQYCETYNLTFKPFILKYRFRNPRLLVTYLSIIKDINKVNPDIIYFANFDQLYLNFFVLLLDRSKTIIALHDVLSHSKTAFSNLVNISKKLLIHRFKYFHTFSSLQHNLLRTNSSGKSIYTISLPQLDFGRPEEVKKNDRVINFLFFGFILYYKGLDLLLTAFESIANEYPNAHLTIAGRCNDWNETYAALATNTTQITTHIRFITNDEIPTLFAKTDYIVLPYRDTTQSGPLMIAYNYNIPALISTAEGFEEFTSNTITGYSFDLSKKGDLEQVLVACVERSKSEYEDLKRSLAIYTEKNFSIRTISSKYTMMFDDILTNRKIESGCTI